MREDCKFHSPHCNNIRCFICRMAEHFKPGDKIICIDNSKQEYLGQLKLKLNHSYTFLRTTRDNYIIVQENTGKAEYYPWRFVREDK